MVFPFETVTKSAAETQKLGEALGHSLLKGDTPRVVCLWGELGSGKTTFVQGLAKGIGITTRLLSPTFIIVRRHEIPARQGFFYHMDLYRTHTPEDAIAVGFADMVNESESLVVIEWPERLGGLLPGTHVDVRFETQKDGTHLLKGSIHG